MPTLCENRSRVANIVQLKEEHLYAKVKEKRLRVKAQKPNTPEDIIKSCSADLLITEHNNSNKGINPTCNTEKIRKGILKHAKTPGSDGTSKYLNPGLAEPNNISQCHSSNKTTKTKAPRISKHLDNSSSESCTKQSEILGKETAPHNIRQIHNEESTLNSNQKEANSWIEAIRNFIFDDADNNAEHGTYIRW